jgi:mRNA interferase MazF
MNMEDSGGPSNPKRGEVWWVSLDPAEGSEMKKTRPAVVISSDAVGTLPVRLVAPLTGWKGYFEKNLWHVRLSPTQRNGLDKESAVDALQVRSVDISRFSDQLGRVRKAVLEEITTAVAIVIEYQ